MPFRRFNTPLPAGAWSCALTTGPLDIDGIDDDTASVSTMTGCTAVVAGVTNVIVSLLSPSGAAEVVSFSASELHDG